MKASFRAEGIDITPEEFVTLSLVSDEGIEQAEFIRESLKDKTNITCLITRLETKGLVKRREHHSSGRQQMIQITKDGLALRLRLFPIAQQTIKRATQGLNAAEIQVARNVLEKISTKLSET